MAPATESKRWEIRTTIDGQEVTGIVMHYGKWDIDVCMTAPVDGLTTGSTIPTFGRGVFKDGFEGDYGRERAMQLLRSLYRQSVKPNEPHM